MTAKCVHCQRRITYSDKDVDIGVVLGEDLSETDCEIVKCPHCRNLNYLVESEKN